MIGLAINEKPSILLEYFTKLIDQKERIGQGRKGG